MKIEYPPYTITDKMLNLATKIMEKIGEANYLESLNRYPELRRKTRIKSIMYFYLSTTYNGSYSYG